MLFQLICFPLLYSVYFLVCCYESFLYIVLRLTARIAIMQRIHYYLSDQFHVFILWSTIDYNQDMFHLTWNRMLARLRYSVFINKWKTVIMMDSYYSIMYVHSTNWNSYSNILLSLQFTHIWNILKITLISKEMLRVHLTANMKTYSQSYKNKN